MKTNARIKWKQDEMTSGMTSHSKEQCSVDRPKKSRQGLRDWAGEIQKQDEKSHRETATVHEDSENGRGIAPTQMERRSKA
jgi:hypothetical protein